MPGYMYSETILLLPSLYPVLKKEWRKVSWSIRPHVKRKLKLLVMAVTMLWLQMRLSGESHLYISNFKSFQHSSGLCCSLLVRNGDYLDNLCSDIPKFPVCTGLSTSAQALPAPACLFFLSNLIHHENCQLGAFESWGLLKIFWGQCPSVTCY